MQLWKTESHCMLSISTDFVWSVDVSYRNDFSTRRCLPVWSAWFCVCDLLVETDPGLEWQSYECGVELKNKLSKATVTTLMTKWNTPALEKRKKEEEAWISLLGMGVLDGWFHEVSAMTTTEACTDIAFASHHSPPYPQTSYNSPQKETLIKRQQTRLSFESTGA